MARTDVVVPVGDPAPAGSREQRRQDRAEQRRAQILEAATRIMTRTGFHAMTMQAVAEEAGISVGLIYQYFGGKGEILQAVVVEILDSFRAEIPAAMDAAGDAPQERLRAGFTTLCAIIDRRRGAVLLTYRETQTLPPAGRELLMRLEQETMAPLVRAVADGIEAGDFRPVSADLVAHNLKTAAHAWALKHWDLAPRFSLDEYVEAELDLVLAALRPGR